MPTILELQDILAKNKDIQSFFLNAILDSVCINDYEFGIAVHSNSFWELLGYDKSEIQDIDDLTNVIHPADFEKTNDFYRRVKETQNRVMSTEYRLRDVEGKYIWFSVKGATVDIGGKLHWIGNMTDISELKNTKEKLQRVTDITYDGFAELDLRSKRLVFTKRYFEMLDIPFQSFLTLDEYILHTHEDYREAARSRIEGYLNGVLEKEQLKDLPLRKSDGSIVYMDITLDPILDHDGKTEKIHFLFRDETPRKQAELMLIERNAIYTALVENVTESLFEYDFVTDDLAFSPAVYSMFAYGDREFTSISDFFERVSETGTSLYVRFKEFIVSKNSADEYSCYFRKGDGSKAFVVCRMRKVHSPLRNREIIVGSFSDKTMQRNYEKQLHEYAYFDHLTKIPNRLNITQMLEGAIANEIANKSNGALLFFDLDGFKGVNDNFGHDYGDELLIQVSKRVLEILPENSSLGRLAGDEFAVIIPNATRELVKATCNDILSVIDADFKIKNELVSISASIGISYFPRESKDVSAVLKFADSAMYYAKNNGKNTFSFWAEISDKF